MTAFRAGQETPPGYAAGQELGAGLRKAAKVTQGVSAAVTDAVSAPLRRGVNLGANVAAGITGGAPVPYTPMPMQGQLMQRPGAAPAPKPAPAAVPLPRPGFSSVVGGASTLPGAPARGAAVSALPSSGAAALPRPGDLNTFTGSNGVTRPIQADGLGAPGSPVAALAPLPMPQAAPAQPAAAQPRLGVPGIRLPSVNTSRVARADAARGALTREIDSLGFRNRIGGIRTRGGREMAEGLLRLQAGLVEDQGGLAGQAAGQVLDAATRAGVANQGQIGENGRALLAEQGDTARQLLAGETIDRQIAAQQAGETFRALHRPTLQEDANGELLRVVGSEATPVRDADGHSVRLPRPELEPGEILAAYSRELNARVEGQPVGATVDPVQILAELDASPLGRARAAVLAAAAPSSAVPPDAAVDHLRQNPSMADAFDRKFGAGSAKRYLTTR